jgi:hypothetical protein
VPPLRSMLWFASSPTQAGPTTLASFSKARTWLMESWTWLPHLAVGLIALPFIVHQNSWYEWANALWLLDLQTAHVAAHGIPTYFIDAPDEYFYPFFVFYGGPTFSFLAYPALVLGTWPVFAATTAGAFIAASAGLSWTARNLGVPSRLAVLPGVLFALTPYTVSNLYGRGAWTELVAVGALGVALGAATSLTSGRARNRPMTIAVLAVAVAGVAGTHNLTLLFSALLVPLLGLALLPLLHGSKRELIHRHLLVLAGAASGVALCGVFLIPDIWLSGRTVASTSAPSFLRVLNDFDSFGVIFNPALSRPFVPGGSDLHTQTLVVPLLWLIVMAAISTRRHWLDQRTGAALGLITLLGVATTLLITNPSWWLSFPSTLQSIQFPFRLVSYLALITVLGLIALLAVPAVQRSRLPILALLLICGWQVGLAVDLAVTAPAQGGEPHPHPTPNNISASSIPTAFPPGEQGAQFRLTADHPVGALGSQAEVGPVSDDTPREIVLSGTQPQGSLVGTDVVASPLIHVTGEATFAGTSPAGFEVLRVSSGRTTVRWHASVAPACNSCLRALTGRAPLALLLGKLASLVGVLALFGWIVAGAGASRARAGSVRYPTKP